jgi:xanthine dehydrogenase/oxidase
MADESWVTVDHPDGTPTPSSSQMPATLPPAQPGDVQFLLNGQRVVVKNCDPKMTLLEYLRYNAGLTGTKGSCRQGGCGACTVMMGKLAINACLRPLAACDGAVIVTTEGQGNARDGYSAVQDAIAKGNGSQCGFCTPGMVMNMHSLLACKPNATAEDVERHFDGNICRCTGYRPILAAFHKLASGVTPTALTECGGGGCAGSTTPCAHQQAVVAASAGPPKSYRGESSSWVEPTTVTALAQAIKSCGAGAGSVRYRLVAGNTGHGVFSDSGVALFINVMKIPAFTSFAHQADGSISLGAGVAINALVELLLQRAVAEQERSQSQKSYFGVLAEHMLKIANNQVRNVGTWAGNLALCHQHREFQSDMATILSAADARVQVVDVDGNVTTVSMEDFFAKDYGALVSLHIPAPPKNGEVLRTYKVMRRHQNAHAVVNAGFAVAVGESSAVEGGGPPVLSVQGTPRLVFGGIVPGP